MGSILKWGGGEMSSVTTKRRLIAKPNAATTSGGRADQLTW